MIFISLSNFLSHFVAHIWAQHIRETVSPRCLHNSRFYPSMTIANSHRPSAGANNVSWSQMGQYGEGRMTWIDREGQGGVAWSFYRPQVRIH